MKLSPDISLDDLPVRDGFRQRGIEMTRIETFTDAAFAFALTLLVVSLDVPSEFSQLVDAIKGIPAFALSGALLMLFWYAHHTWSRNYGLDDLVTILLSIILVFTVLVYVYPLKFVAAGFMRFLGQVTDWPVGSKIKPLSSRELYALFVIYGVGFVAMCLAILLLYAHAWRRRDTLRLNAVERFDTLASIGCWAVIMSSGLLSIAVALLTDPTYIAWPGWAYGMLPVVMPVYGRVVTRRRPPA